MTEDAKLEVLNSRKEEITKAFSIVMHTMELASEMGEEIPPGVYNYLWNKWFKLEGLEIRL